jgi:DNA primase
MVRSGFILALDTDFAGDAAARRGIEIAEQENLRIRVADLGSYKDPDEMAQKDPESLKAAIDKAEPVWDYLIESVFSKFKKVGGETKALISRELVPILARIRNEIVRAHYVKEVAGRLDVPYEAVVKEIQKLERQNLNEVVFPINVNTEKKEERRDLLEEKLLALSYLINPKKLIDDDFPKLIKSTLGIKLLQSYNNYSKKVKKFSISSFSAYLPEELKYGFSEMILIASNEEPETEEKALKEIILLKREIRILDIKEEQKRLAEEIKLYEKSQDKTKLKIAEEKFDKLSKRLKLE